MVANVARCKKPFICYAKEAGWTYLPPTEALVAVAPGPITLRAPYNLQRK